MLDSIKRNRTLLPHESDAVFLTDGGIETCLIFHEGRDLPCFAAFTLVDSTKGRATLRRYFERNASVAVERGLGFILDTPTWRASPDWGDKLGYDSAALDRVNRESVELLREVRDSIATGNSSILINGSLGPRGDGYVVGDEMTASEAEAYHLPQVRTLARAGVDMVSAITMTYPAEATGIVRAASLVGIPVAIAFTVETDGRLPGGQTISEAIMEVDRETGNGPIYYMINCAHPTHFQHELLCNAHWLERVRGIRANASTMSHSELDEATELDDGNPEELGRQYRDIRRILPAMTVMGGCCGTDFRHIEAIANEACEDGQLPSVKVMIGG